MKRIFVFTAVFFSIASLAQTQSPVVGTWKLVSSKITSNDTTQTYTSADLNCIKIISPTHFAVLAQKGDSSFSHSVAGAVTITADTYTEAIEYGSFPNLKGQKSVFRYEVKGDQLHTTGGMKEMSFDEVWTRIRQ